MLWNRNRNQIIEDWQESLDYSLEAGDTPLFDIGLSHNTLDGFLSLVAAQDFSALPKPTLTYPTLTIGGNSPLWLLTLDRHWLKMLQLQTTQKNKPVSDTVPVLIAVPEYRFDTTFTAVDPATHMASLTVNAGPSRNIISRSPKARATGLPAALRALTFPQLEPAVISTWQALPLTISLPKPQLRMLRSAQSSSPPSIASSGNRRGYLPQRATLHTDGGPEASEFDSHASRPQTNVEEPAVDPKINNDDWVSIVALVVCLLLILVALL